jgi:hypothetical protein
MPLTVKSAPNPVAVAKLAARTPVASRLTSAEWERMPLALRERAQFSATIDAIRVTAAIQDKMMKVVSMQREKVARGEAFVDRGSFIADIRRVAREEGVGGPATQGYGTLRDIQSSERLQLIYDFQAESAAQYARWKVAQDPDALDNFPAREFLRVESRQAPRDWAPRWNAAFAPFEGATRAQDGRMVALVNHPGWMKLSRFGTPWPPFDFGSGMGVESVDRSDAIALGIIAPDQRLEPAEKGFNDALEASVEGLSPESRQRLTDAFGDQVQFRGDRAVWLGNLIGDLVDDVREWMDSGRPFDSHAFKGQSIDLGMATGSAARLAAPYMDISRLRLQLAPDNIQHMLGQHGEDRETRGDQRPVTKLDIEVLPHVWREPDKVESGDKPRSLVFWKRILGKTRMVEWNQNPKTNVMIPSSVLVKKETAG